MKILQQSCLFFKPFDNHVIWQVPLSAHLFPFFLCPQEGLAPINLVVETEMHRATPGGTGGVKTVGNYAAVSYPYGALIY